MGRKKDIEGQLNFLDMLMSEAEKEDVAQDGSSEHTVGEDSVAGKDTEQVEKRPISERKTSSAENAKTSHKAGGFKECAFCWCATCEHSTVGGSVPRPLSDGMRPCPACELCVKAGKADICVIGSADEGCRHRAEKEGLE